MKDTAAEHATAAAGTATPGFSTFNRAVSPNASPTIPDVSTVGAGTT